MQPVMSASSRGDPGISELCPQIQNLSLPKCSESVSSIQLVQQIPNQDCTVLKVSGFSKSYVFDLDSHQETTTFELLLRLSDQVGTTQRPTHLQQHAHAITGFPPPPPAAVSFLPCKQLAEAVAPSSAKLKWASPPLVNQGAGSRARLCKAA